MSVHPVRPTLAFVGGVAGVMLLASCSSSKSADPAVGTDSTSGVTQASDSASATGSPAASSVTATTAPAAPTTSAAGSALGLDDTYYPVGVGNTWVYRTDYGASSLGVVTDTEVMTAVTPVADGASVTFVRTFHYLKAGHADFKSTVKYVFHHDGSLTVPYQSDAASANAKITV
jgi:hypothetical protein